MQAPGEYHGPKDWFGNFHTGSLTERCEAVLVIGETFERTASVIALLYDALDDPEEPVQIAAKIALGTIVVATPERAKLMEAFSSNDEGIRRRAMQSLVLFANDVGTQTQPHDEPQIEHGISEELPIQGPSTAWTSPVERSVQVEDSPTADLDVSLVFRLPTWFLVCGVCFCVLMCFILRGYAWARWPMAAAVLLRNPGEITSRFQEGNAR